MDEKKIIYDWGKRFLRRIEIFGSGDINKKTSIPTGGKYSRIHDEVVNKKNKKK